MKTIRNLLALLALLCSTFLSAAEWAPGSTDWTSLPAVKVSKAGLYLTPREALEMKQQNQGGVAFFDVRTRAEAMYVGMAGAVDALVPFVEHQEIMTDWDEKRSMYRLEPNQEFVAEIGHRLQELGLGKDAPIILMCRSGDRSSKAADRLLAAGYTRVYSVPEGFEGDKAADGPRKGQRAVNGWRNAGLPWSYKLERRKMFFPR